MAERPGPLPSTSPGVAARPAHCILGSLGWSQRPLCSPGAGAKAFRLAKGAPEHTATAAVAGWGLGPVLTMAVGIVTVPGSVVPTQPAQQQAVLHQPLDGLQQERVERQVADFLELELSIHCLQLLKAFGCLFQFCQDLIVPLEVAGKLLLRHERGAFRFGDLGEGPVGTQPVCLDGVPSVGVNY